MSVCPFCKASVGSSSGPCPKCGKRAADHPSIAGSGGRSLGADFDEGLEAPDLVLESGGSVGRTPAAGGAGSAGHPSSSSYESSGGGGMTFDDDDILQDSNAADLELDMPSPPPSNRSLEQTPPGPGTSGQHAAVAAPSSQRQLAGAPPQSSGSLPAPHSSGSLPASDGPASGQVAAVQAPVKVAPPPDPAALVVAKYPPPPSAIWQAPVYACKVLWRQFELRQDLESLRRRRSPDVGLYERALRAHDKKSFALGLAIVIAGMTLATFVFFLPVIIRFVRAPD